MISRRSIVVVALALGVHHASAQTPAQSDSVRGARPVSAPPACPRFTPPRSPSAGQRQQARDLAQRGQRAAILGDRVAARDQLRLAARLDPADPDLAYQLARAEEGAGNRTEAATEYCRFLALAPDAPDAAEARARVADLLFRSERPPVPAVMDSAAATTRIPAIGRQPLSATRALTLGLVIPGAGQFYAGRTARGLLTLAGTGAAVACGLRQTSASREVQESALDPFGNPYTYTVTRQVSERPCLAPGLAVAGVIAVASAIDAFRYVRQANERSRVSVAIVPDVRRFELRVTVR